MKVCVGLILVLFCPEDAPPPVVDSFCSIAGPQIQMLYRLSDAELAALSRSRKAAIAKLRRNYEKQCPQR